MLKAKPAFLDENSRGIRYLDAFDMEDKATVLTLDFTRRFTSPKKKMQMLQDSILATLKKDNADLSTCPRGVIQVTWKRTKPESGHVFNWEIDSDGTVLLLDAQVNVENEDLVNYFGCSKPTYAYFRLDDKPIKDGIIDAVENLEEKK